MKYKEVLRLLNFFSEVLGIYFKSVALDEQMVFVLENITKSTNNLPRGLKPDCAEAHMKTGIVCKASPWS